MNPFADRLRPQSLDEFTGQNHLVGKGKPIRIMIENGQTHSMIFWGPPGCGKTTLARIIANATHAHFIHLSAVDAGVKDIRGVIQHANERQKLYGKQTILFIDEIHRFNKAQQDFLLPYVEDGTITFIGATTENPSFEIISPLLSRCQIFVLNELSKKELQNVLVRGAKKLKARIPKKASEFLVEFANGDARQLLNFLETTKRLYKKITIKNLKEALQSKHLRYDMAGEEHYNTISAFIKSMRASDANAAIYYLARMVEAGEDSLFIARRIVIFASEDVGMAQPTALVIANEVFHACETIGYPECAINLAQATIYLAKAKKDRSAYDALRAAQADVKKHGNLPIPLNLRNASTKLMKELGYGKNYEAYPGKEKNLLPNALKGKKYYQESNSKKSF